MQRPRELLCISMTLAAALVAGIEPACTPELPPHGELRLTVHTDALVPEMAARLRLDVYDQDGTWIDSRSAFLRSPREWPASFSVFSSSAREHRVRVRLRVHREGAVREYRGERYVPPPPPEISDDAEPPELAGDGRPRLVREGVDVTPPEEPIPESAVDRLAWVTLREGEVRQVTWTLRLACAGTAADLAGDRTCEGERNVLVPAPEIRSDAPGPAPWQLRLAEDLAKLPPPRARSHAADGTPLFDEQVLVPGGPFVLGSRAEEARFFSHNDPLPEPERVFVAPPMLVDRHEVTVGRFRDALRRGFQPPTPVGIDPTSPACTFTSERGTGRDDFEVMPITCVAPDTAAAFCAFEGAELPSEAEWEYVAAVAGRARKTAFPWGNEPAACEDAVFGRFRAPGILAPCGDSARPASVETGPGDVTPLGVHGLAGNVAEMVRDQFFAYTAACWARAPVYDPECPRFRTQRLLVRGMAWTTERLFSVSFRREIGTGRDVDVGFRCIRR